MGFVLLGGAVFPFLFGIFRGAGVVPKLAGIGGEELLIVAVVGPMLLALVSGAILSLIFRPTLAQAAKGAKGPAKTP